jgi:GTPase
VDKEQRAALAAEMTQLQRELANALNGLRDELGSKLKPEERAELDDEINELNELIERLKTGKVWLAFFGRAAVGKSSVINSLLGEDRAAMGVEYDTTGTAYPYDMSLSTDNPYMLVDVPGIMSNPGYEEMAIAEAQKAHGHVFVLEAEPTHDEIEIFDFVKKNTPHSPTIVFVNKADRFDNMPKSDVDIVKGRIIEKMGKYVDSELDIIFGSARLFDKASDEMVRQSLPNLEDRLYNNPGTLGQVVNVFDPANRAELNLEMARTKILEVRKKVARRIIKAFAFAEAGASAVPFDAITTTPGLLVALTHSVTKIMGEGQVVSASQLTVSVVKVCAQTLGGLFVFATAASVLIDVIGPWGWLFSAAAFAGFKYSRTLIYGEALLLYIENGFSFGDEARVTILKAKENAGIYYKAYRRKR